MNAEEFCSYESIKFHGSFYLEWPGDRDGLYGDLRGSHPAGHSLKWRTSSHISRSVISDLSKSDHRHSRQSDNSHYDYFKISK